MKRSMCITYVVEGSLYVNITNRCSNRCDFCIRNNGDGAYGSDSLWLEREPTEEEILFSILSRDLSEYPEIVFCGYGEPTYRLDCMLSVARAVKEKCPDIRLRLNTNGQSDLICGEDTAQKYRSVFDKISISLNTPSAKRYVELCHPVFGESAYPAILSFAKNVKKYVSEVAFSVVGEFLTEDEIRECKRIAEECGVSLRIRDYIPREA